MHMQYIIPCPIGSSTLRSAELMVRAGGSFASNGPLMTMLFSLAPRAMESSILLCLQEYGIGEFGMQVQY